MNDNRLQLVLMILAILAFIASIVVVFVVWKISCNLHLWLLQLHSLFYQQVLCLLLRGRDMRKLNNDEKAPFIFLCCVLGVAIVGLILTIIFL